jgi:hypothetical protein
MYKIFCFYSVVIIFFSCTQTNNPNAVAPNNTTSSDSVAIINDPKYNLNIQTNNFLEIDTSGVLMFPLSASESVRASGSITYKEMPVNNYWNIVFYNGNKNEYHLLTDKKILIKIIDAKINKADANYFNQLKQYIFYTAITTDYNNDRVFNDDDPKYLFVSDKQGNNFKQISPLNCDFIGWEYFPSIHKLFLKVKKDSDKNYKFDEQDEATTFKIDLDKDSTSSEIFLPDFKNKLKLLYDKDWKRVK